MSDNDIKLEVAAARWEQLLALIAGDEPPANWEPGDGAFGDLERGLSRRLTAAAEEQQRLEQALADAEHRMQLQRLAIEDLSTPVIDLWDGILTLPLVGAIDTHRAVEMNERLLTRIVDTEARCVIIDLTGVKALDTKTVDHVVKMTKAASLIGAQCVLSGIGPEIAVTLADLDVEMGEIRTLRTLKDGLRWCFEFLVHEREHGPGFRQTHSPATHDAHSATPGHEAWHVGAQEEP